MGSTQSKTLCSIKYLYYPLSLSIKCIPIEASGKQPLFCSVLCQSRPGCVTVSVCSVRVTVLASVPQKLASIYKFSTFLKKNNKKLCPPGH